MKDPVLKMIGQKGGFTIPQQLRHQLGLRGGMVVTLTPTESGGLLLQKHRPTCHICGGTDDVVTFNGFDVCRTCFRGIREEVEKLD